MLANIRFGNVEQEPYLDSRTRVQLEIERWHTRQRQLERRLRRAERARRAR